MCMNIVSFLDSPPNFAAIKVEDDAWNALIAVVTALVQGYMNNQ